MYHKSRAFTQIDLLAVILIVVFLIAIPLAALTESTEAARRTLCADNVQQQAMTFFAYQNDYEMLPHSYVSDPAVPDSLIGESGGPYTFNAAMDAIYGTGSVFDKNSLTSA